MTRLKKNKQSSTASVSSHPAQTTFVEHVRELRRRLTWVALWFVVVTGAIFPFYRDIIKLLMQPLGHEKLYYLTPIGGVGFAIKVCMYVGMVAALPVLVYHLYRFISPVMRQHSAKQAAVYMLLSALLAGIGIVFAYVVSLPSALKFLTNFNIGNVSAMLTVDSYLSFIIAYVLASALMFQIPLIMVIIDKITPTPPLRWNRYQRHMIVAAFIIAMLVSPSPEITTQVMLALPIIVMYQMGIGLVWLNHRSHRSKSKRAERATTVAEPTPQSQQEAPVAPVVTPVAASPVVTTVTKVAPQVRRAQTPGRVDVLMRYTPPVRPRSTSVAVPARAPRVTQQPLATQLQPDTTPRSPSRPTIDGVFRPTSS